MTAASGSVITWVISSRRRAGRFRKRVLPPSPRHFLAQEGRPVSGVRWGLGIWSFPRAEAALRGKKRLKMLPDVISSKRRNRRHKPLAS